MLVVRLSIGPGAVSGFLVRHVGVPSAIAFLTGPQPVRLGPSRLLRRKSLGEEAMLHRRHALAVDADAKAAVPGLP